MVAASLTGYPAAFYLYLYLYICIMTIYAKNIKYHMEYYVTGPFFLVTAAIFTVILLQNKRRSLHFSISSPLLSNSVPQKISRCSWFSSTPRLQCWQDKSSQECLKFPLTPAIALALYLIHSLRGRKVHEVWF